MVGFRTDGGFRRGSWFQEGWLVPRRKAVLEGKRVPSCTPAAWSVTQLPLVRA